MSEWREVPIGELMAEFHDGPHATPKPSQDGPVFLGIKNVTEAGSLEFSSVRHISQTDFPRWTKRVTPRAGDIVFTYEATLHRYALIPEGFDGCLGRRLALIRTRPDRADPRYLHQALRSPAWRKTVEERVIAGATVDRIPLIDFPSFPIRVPGLLTQRRIAAVLAAFDELIAVNERRIKILEDLARSLYREWFVRLRFPGHKAKSEGGVPLPAGWRSARLSDVAELVMGQSPRSEFYNDVGFGLPFHQGVSDYGPLIPTHRKFSSQGSRRAQVWDVLCSVRAPVGRLNIADRELILGRGLAAIRRRDRRCALLLEQLRHGLGEEDSIGGGTIYKAVGKEELSSIPIVEPTSELRASFELVARPMLDQRVTLVLTNRALAQTRDLLLPRIVTGRLDISDVDLGDLLGEELSP
jgi:type I restriction enzyme, S subunit